MIETILHRLNHSERIEPEEVLVINTIPLSKERFRNGWSWIKRKNDFLRSQYPSNITWEMYQKLLVSPVLAELLEIVSKGAGVVDYDVSWKQFNAALHSEQFKVYFLLAHHIEEEDSIEFADGSIAYTEMYAYLNSFSSSTKKSIHFFICTAENFLGLKEESGSSIGPVSFAFWNLPVRSCYRFVRYWVLNLKKCGNISQAYTQSIKQFEYDNFSNEP